jgi:drug/metabolite transporter (DMT)-like permease
MIRRDMAETTPQKDESEHLVRGMWAGAGAILMFTLMNVAAKHLSASHSIFEIVFFRNLIACVPFLLAGVAFGRREIFVIQSKPHIIATRGIIGTVTLTMTIFAFSLMPMAETTVLLFTASLFIPVLGVLILKERVGPYRWSAVLTGFIGVSIMVQPTGAVTIVGVTVALCAALLQAFMSILLRHLGGHERPETISFYFFVIGTILSGLVMPFVATGPTPAEIPFFIVLGLTGAAAQWLYSTALKYTPAALVAVINYSSIVWAILFGWLVWNDWPLPIVFAGATIVIASNLLIIWREKNLRGTVQEREAPTP